MKFFLFFIILLVNFSSFSGGFSPENDEGEKKSITKPITTVLPKDQSMAWKKHFNYTGGALGGSLAGSFFVHCFDTIAARRFSHMEKSSFSGTVKSIFRSYLPVAVGVVPMRAASFGVYSIAQDLFEGVLEGSQNKTMAAMLSGVCLAALSTPAEIMKTRKQIEIQTSAITLKDVKGNFIPLACRVVPTVTCMLAGTEIIRAFLPFDGLFLSMTCASLTAATISQIIGTPAENIRIYRIKQSDYSSSLCSILKNKHSIKTLYTGFWLRSLSLGIQASFTLSAAHKMVKA